jgi:hypothetical protein
MNSVDLAASGASVVRGFLKSAKGADARRQTVKEVAESLGGALDTATVLREFPSRTTVDLQNCKRYDEPDESP